MLLRMDRFLSVGLGLTRTEAKSLLAEGAVTQNGRVVRSAAEKVDSTACVLVNGTPVQYREHSYLLLNKPLGVVSSTEEAGSVTVLDLVPASLRRRGLFPAGRLDKYSEGMLLLTDDGEFAHRILAPRSHLPKTYAVTLDAPILNEALAEKFQQGVPLGGGEFSSPAILTISDATHGRVTIFEGIYHEVRRMFDQNGAHVIRLVRVQIGGLPLDPALAPGEVRPLTEEEMAQLLSPLHREEDA